MKFKPIKKQNLPQAKNVKFLIGLEKQAKMSFKMISASILKEISGHFKTNKLAKSDRLPKGWSGDVAKISVDLEKIINPVMKKHMNALRWLLYGDMAGKEAKEAAQKVGIKAKALPGLLPSAYLQSIDAQRDYYTEVIGQEAPELNKDLILESMKELIIRTQKFLDEFSMKFGNGITETIQKEIDAQNYTNISQSLLTAHEALDTGYTPAEALDEAIDNIDGLNLPGIVVNIEDIISKTEISWDMFATANIGMASAVGTHTAMTEIYGIASDQIKVVLLMIEDERTCTFCIEKSKSNGEYIYYDLSDFKPTGYNYGRKRRDWELTVPPEHPRCRCVLVYCPPGFIVDKNGTLTKK